MGIATSILEELASLNGPQKPWDNSNVRMATIDPNYDGVGLPRVQFDGEQSITVSGYYFLCAYTPQPSERVVMLRISTRWVILGDVVNGARGYRDVASAPELPSAARDGDLARVGESGWYEYDGPSATWKFLRTWGTAWGRVATAATAGGQTTATTTMVTLMTSSVFELWAGREYTLSVNQPWRGNTAGNVLDLDVILNINGVDTIIRAYRDTNAIASTGNSTENVSLTIPYSAVVNDATCFMKCTAARLSGTGTITMASGSGFVDDAGVTPS